MDVRTLIPSSPRALLLSTAGVVVVAGAGFGAWHHFSGSPTGGRVVYSGVQGASTTTPSNGSRNGANNGPASAGDPHTFTISGSLGDVFPGQDSTVYLTVDNPNSEAIQVTSLTLSVGDASATCLHSNLSPSSETVTFSVVVPKNSSLGGTSFPMPMSMLPSASDGCQGATFPLTLSGTATGPA